MDIIPTFLAESAKSIPHPAQIGCLLLVFMESNPHCVQYRGLMWRIACSKWGV